MDLSDYVVEDPGISYQKTLLDDLSTEEREVDDDLHRTTADLDSLKQRICQETNEDISTSWEALLDKFREHRETVADEYRFVTALI